MLQQRKLRARRLAIGRETVDVLVIGGEELFQDALGARVQRIADGGDVALRVASVLLVIVRRRVVDVPVFFERLRLLIFVLECLLDQLVELGRAQIGFAVRLIGPVAKRVRYRIGRGGWKLFFFSCVSRLREATAARSARLTASSLPIVSCASCDQRDLAYRAYGPA
ncbi:MAG: hypothetical protein ACRETG_11675, partial [Steroidobacteraceae bacterium]